MLEEQAVSNQGHGSSANVRMAIEVYWQKAMSISLKKTIKLFGVFLLKIFFSLSLIFGCNKVLSITYQV